MLTSQMIEQTAHNRQQQKDRIPYSLILSKISAKDYQDLVQWMGCVQNLCRALKLLYFYIILDQFQVCEHLGLAPNTMYYSRFYFDQALILYQDILAQKYLQLLLSCLSLSIKFNENSTKSNQLTPRFLFIKSQLPFSMDQYYQFQATILQRKDFRLRATVPHDYIDAFMEAFTWFPNLRPGLISVMAFPLVFPKTCQYSAQEIFYGVVLAIFETKKVRLNQMQQRVLRGMTDCWQNAHKIGQATVAAINRYSVAQATN